MIIISRQAYPTDLKDQEWQLIEPLLPPPATVGRPQEWPLREILDAIFYIVKSGCQWRMLPHDLPPKDSVYYHFSKWRKNGVWQAINDSLVQQVRQAEGREALPSAAALDAQSVKTGHSAETRGYDAGKKVTGRKRHILVDTLGLLLFVLVTEASTQDRDGAKQLLAAFKKETFYQRMQRIWADGSYRGQLIEWVQEKLSIVLEAIVRPKGSKGFVLLRRRWVVERTFGWFAHYRRLDKDYEQQTANSEAFIYIAMIRLMLNRLAMTETLKD